MWAEEGTGDQCRERTGNFCLSPSHNFQSYYKKSAGEQKCNKCLYRSGTLWNLPKCQPTGKRQRGKEEKRQRVIFTHLTSLAGSIPICNHRAGGAVPTGRCRSNLNISLQDILLESLSSISCDPCWKSWWSCGASWAVYAKRHF